VFALKQVKHTINVFTTSTAVTPKVEITSIPSRVSGALPGVPRGGPESCLSIGGIGMVP
jgi:hypothetical protein